MKFEGTPAYVATDDLKLAVNAAITLERPLLVKGEPGTGKWEAFESEERVILLIDEIDKADIEFPNDLLQELDKMEFYVYETDETIKAKQRPIIIITSNNEKELPDAFLRRCFFHYIAFPDRATLQRIVDDALPEHQERPGQRGAGRVLRRAQSARPEEEALHFRTGGLAETADGRQHRRSGVART